MDIAVQLALLEKIKAIFASNNTFVMFPRGPISFMSKDLLAIVDTASSGEELQVLADWTRAINPIPTSGRWLDLSGPFLWEVLDRVFQSSVELASGDLSPVDELKLHAAQDLLYRVDHTSRKRLYSDKYQSYKEYEEVWNTWIQAFRERGIQVSNSTDPHVRQHWLLVERPAFERRIQQAESDWELFGFRGEVEQALDDIQIFGARSPRQQWNTWKRQLSLSLDSLGDLNSIKFVSTGFSPVNFMNSGTWPSLVLEKAEISTLLTLVSPNVLSQYSINLGNVKIARVAFEFTSVGILRSWFSPEMFRSKFWRFRDRSRVLSNGEVPPNGELPGYVDSVIFIRNLVVDTEADDEREDDGVASGPFPNMKDLDIFPIPTIPTPRTPIEPRPFPPPRGPVTDPPFSAIPLPHPLPIPRRADLFDTASALTSLGSTRLESVSFLTNNRWRDLLREGRVNGFERRTADINSIRVFQDSLRQAAPKPRTTTSSDHANAKRKLTFADGKLGVIAYVCKAFPRCPDPDPRLNWT